MVKHAEHGDIPPGRRSRKRPGGGAHAVSAWGQSAWSRGTCFRCDRSGLQVALIGTFPTLAMEAAVRACQSCLRHIEQIHWATMLGDEGAVASGEQW